MYFLSYQTPTFARPKHFANGRLQSYQRTFGGNDERKSQLPRVDLVEDSETFTLLAELPGLKREDFQLSLREDTVTLSGEVRREKPAEEKSFLRNERNFGKFERQFTLPTAFNADKVTASYANGILTVVLPKAEEGRPRQIEIK